MEKQKDAVELKEFINSTMNAIERGADLKHRSISGSVEFELTVKETNKREGGAKIYVVAGNARSEKENTATIKFNIASKSKPEGAVVKTKPPSTKLHI
jgi:hypothetical protein